MQQIRMCPQQIKIELFEIGKYVKGEIEKTNQIRQNIKIIEYVIMLNHIHMIVQIMNGEGTVPHAPTSFEKFGIPTKQSIPTVIRYLKCGVTRMYNKKYKCDVKIWQRGYYEHIIRNEKEYFKICEYIKNNPMNYGRRKILTEVQ